MSWPSSGTSPWLSASARPLKRTIQRLVQDPLSMRILEGEFRKGDAVRVDVKKGEIEFSKK